MWSRWEAQRQEVTSETTGLMTGLIPEANSGIAPPPIWPDGNSWGGSTVFVDGQLHTKGSRPDRVSEGRKSDNKPAEVDYIRIMRAKVMILSIALEVTPLNRVANRYLLRGTMSSYSLPSCPRMLSMATCHYSRLSTRQLFPHCRRSDATQPRSRKASQK